MSFWTGLPAAPDEDADESFCTHCNGDGVEPFGAADPCSMCDGEGIEL